MTPAQTTARGLPQDLRPLAVTGRPLAAGRRGGAAARARRIDRRQRDRLDLRRERGGGDPAQPRRVALELGDRHRGDRADRRAVDAHLEVEVRPGRAAGRADLADRGPGVDRGALGRLDPAQVRVARHHAAAMVDLDHVAVAAHPPAERHDPGAGRHDRGARLAPEVGASVKAARVADRIIAPAKARRLGAGHRLEHQHRQIGGLAIGPGQGGEPIEGAAHAVAGRGLEPDHARERARRERQVEQVVEPGRGLPPARAGAQGEGGQAGR